MSAPHDSIDAMIPARLSAADAVTLSRALLTAFDAARHVDASVKRAARHLREASESLRVAWEANVRASISADHGTSARRADLDEDAVWLALYHWLKGWSLLPAGYGPERDTAKTVLDALFEDGTGFTNLTYALEWAEADRRLSLIDGDGHAARIESLGGAAMLAAIRDAHEAYELALGVSHRVSVPPDAVGAALAPMVDATQSALAEYVRAAIAATTPGDAESEARREALVAPVRRWHAEQQARARRHSAPE